MMFLDRVNKAGAAISAAILSGGLLFSASAVAQGLSIEDATGTGTISTDLGFVAQNSIAQFTVDISFDNTSLTPALDNPGDPAPDVSGCVSTPGANWEAAATACRLINPNTIRVVVASGFAANVPLDTADPFGSITWTVAGSAEPGDSFPLTTEIDTVIAGGVQLPDSDLDVDEGSATVEVPAGESFYSSNPAIGANIIFGSGVVGSSAGVQAIAVQNLQDDGSSDFEITAAGGTSAGATIAVPSPTFPQTIPANGGVTTQNINFECTPTARGPQSGTLTITNDSDNAGPEADYTFDCTGLSPNVNVPAGPVAISGLTVDTNPLTGTFDVTNPDDGFTSDAMNVTASAAGDPEISVAPAGPLMIATDGSQPFTVSCDNANDGNFTSTITIEWDDPVSGGSASDTVDATCDVTNAVASFDSNPTAPGPLAFGTVTNGVTSSPIGIDVGNDGIGPAPDSDLTISSVVSSDPSVFTFNVINFGPFPVGAPDGSDDIEVTCTPNAVGAISGTITVNHNGDDDPTVFDATCTGESDGTFASTPAAGGTLDLGIVTPGDTTPEGFIDFTNNGAVDDIEVSCTVDDPDDVFTFTPDPIAFTLAPGATEPAGFQCTPTIPTSFEATVMCDIDGDPGIQSANYTVICQGQPLFVPTMNRWGLLLMVLLVLGLGGLAGRRMMA